MKRKKSRRPGTIISAYVSLEAYVRLRKLCEKYNMSQSKMIEKMILTVYEAVMEKEEATDEATATA
jgi:hypothetical protein